MRVVLDVRLAGVKRNDLAGLALVEHQVVEGQDRFCGAFGRAVHGEFLCIWTQRSLTAPVLSSAPRWNSMPGAPIPLVDHSSPDKPSPPTRDLPVLVRYSEGVENRLVVGGQILDECPIATGYSGPDRHVGDERPWTSRA